jgi:2-polyprenyl-3-methyl-5-hydroxy-6-metoxy-1,4-benzoquinol methylase
LDLSREARQIYATGSTGLRLMMAFRPYLCPFDRLIRQVPHGATVLDIGCGGGLFLSLLSRLGMISSGVGFDTGAAAIGLARDAASHRPAQESATPLEFMRRSVAEEWPAGQFTVVALVDLLHHLPDKLRRPTIQQAAAHLAPGGILLYKDIGPSPVWRAIGNSLHDLVLARQLVHYTALDRIDAWAAEEGLACEVRESPHRLWYSHELRVYRAAGGPSPQGLSQ